MKSENHWRCRGCRTEFKEGEVQIRHYCSRSPGPSDSAICPACGLLRAFEYIGPPDIPPADARKFTSLVPKRIEFPLFDNDQAKPAPILKGFQSYVNPGRKATMIRSDETFSSVVVWTRDQLRKLADVDCPICLGSGVVGAVEPTHCNCIWKGLEE